MNRYHKRLIHLQSSLRASYSLFRFLMKIPDTYRDANAIAGIFGTGHDNDTVSVGVLMGRGDAAQYLHAVSEHIQEHQCKPS